MHRRAGAKEAGEVGTAEAGHGPRRDDRIHGVLLLVAPFVRVQVAPARHLAVRDDDQDVVRAVVLRDDLDGLADGGRERRGPRQADERRELAVAPDHRVERVARLVVGLEGEHVLVARRSCQGPDELGALLGTPARIARPVTVAEAIRLDEAVVVKGLQSPADSGDCFLVWVGGVPDAVQAAVAEGVLAGPFVALVAKQGQCGPLASRRSGRTAPL
jgi:hypothetical protein